MPYYYDKKLTKKLENPSNKSVVVYYVETSQTTLLASYSAHATLEDALRYAAKLRSKSPWPEDQQQCYIYKVTLVRNAKGDWKRKSRSMESIGRMYDGRMGTRMGRHNLIIKHPYKGWYISTPKGTFVVRNGKMEERIKWD